MLLMVLPGGHTRHNCCLLPGNKLLRDCSCLLLTKDPLLLGGDRCAACHQIFDSPIIRMLLPIVPETWRPVVQEWGAAVKVSLSTSWEHCLIMMQL
jgi:hypothetical protein